VRHAQQDSQCCVGRAWRTAQPPSSRSAPPHRRTPRQLQVIERFTRRQRREPCCLRGTTEVKVRPTQPEATCVMGGRLPPCTQASPAPPHRIGVPHRIVSAKFPPAWQAGRASYSVDRASTAGSPVPSRPGSPAARAASGVRADDAGDVAVAVAGDQLPVQRGRLVQIRRRPLTATAGRRWAAGSVGAESSHGRHRCRSTPLIQAHRHIGRLGGEHPGHESFGGPSYERRGPQRPPVSLVPALGRPGLARRGRNAGAVGALPPAS
jgi:hypothetical protein